MLFGILLTLEVLVAIGLVGVILLQRSEGGALGIGGGGGGGGFMTARGAGNLLTRTTGVLATMFFLLAIGLTILGNINRGNTLASRVSGKVSVDALSPTKRAPAPNPNGLPGSVPVTAPIFPAQGAGSAFPNLANPVAPAGKAAPAQPAAGVDPLANIAPSGRAPQPASNRKP